MKKIALGLLLAIMGFSAFGQHFSTNWSGHGLDHMNFYFTGATINSVNMVAGDEIAVFDGSACIGFSVLTGELTGGAYLQVLASKDDDGTPAIDGYTPGNSYSVRIWDQSASLEISSVNESLQAGESVFVVGAYASLTISATVAVNTAPEVSGIPDQSIEPCATFSTIALDDFVYDAETSDAYITWTYSGNTDLQVSISNRIATISLPYSDWYGSEDIEFIATDDESPNPLSGSDVSRFTVEQIGIPVIGDITQPSCDIATGSVELSGLPSIGAWTLTRSPGGVSTGGTGTDATVTGLTAGSYTFTVTNTYGCVSDPSTSVVISQQPETPDAPTLSSVSQPTCDLATGTLELGNLPSSGIWTLTRSPGEATTGTGSKTTINSLAAGTYTFTVENAAGCSSGPSDDIVINTQPAPPSAPTIGDLTQPTCDVATGSAVLEGLPATGTWNLTRSPGGASSGTGTETTISSLAEGSYTFVVTNADNCTSAPSLAVVINSQPETPTAPIVGAIVHPTCTQALGSVVLEGLPASGTWTLTMSPGGTTTSGTGTSTTITGLSEGSYTFIVANETECNSPASGNVVLINETEIPYPPTVETVTQPGCNVATASVVLTGLPATGSWTLTRSPGSVVFSGSGNNTTISGLTSDTYTYIVSNADGCVSAPSEEIVINTQPQTPTAPDLEALTQPTCDVATGFVEFSGLPTTGTWTLTRNPGNLSSSGTGETTTISGLSEGSYTFSVTNTDGCNSDPTASLVINSQPPTPDTPGIGTIVNPDCIELGSIEVNGLPSNGTWILTMNPGAVTTTGSGENTTITGLDEGTYTFNVANEVNCVSDVSAEAIVVNSSVIPDAPVEGSITQPTCNVATGEIELTGLPSGTWTLTRNPGDITTTGSSATTTISGLPAGSYTFTATTADGCISNASESIVIYAQPETPEIPVIDNVTHPSCELATGSVELVNLPATGTWTITRYPGGISSDGTGVRGTISGIAAGTYTFEVTNEDGCTSGMSVSVVINEQPENPDAPLIGTITHPYCDEATGSMILNGLPNSGAWILTRYPGGITTDGSGNSITVTGLNPNGYTFTITNEVGCTSSVSESGVINLPPITPNAPEIGTIIQSTCTQSTGGLVLSGLPGTGEWTISGDPGGFTSSGTGSNTSVSGLSPGTYTFVVTSAAGCSSLPSRDVVIDDQPDTPDQAISLPTSMTSCEGEGVHLNAGDGFDTYSWNTGESTQAINVTTAGTYTVTVTEGVCSASADALVKFNSIPDVDLGGDLEVCAGESVTLDAGAGFNSYLWSTGATSRTISVSSAGTYDVVVTIDGCSNTDAVQVSVTSLPIIPLDASYYSTSCVTLDAGNSGSTYIWNTGANTQTISTCTSGTYNVTVTNSSGCSSSMQTSVTIGDTPIVKLPDALSGCEGEAVLLDAGSGFASYLWNTGATSQTISVSSSGVYSVTVKDAHDEEASDDVTVTFHALPDIDLGTSKSICAGETVSLDAGSGFSSYSWSTGQTTSSIIVSQAATYNVTVSDGRCSNSDQVIVSVKSLPDVNLGSDRSECEGDDVVLDAGAGFETYNWSTGSTERSIAVTSAGTYSVTVTNNGCSSSDAVSITFLQLPEVELGPNITFCEGESVMLNAGAEFTTYTWSTGENTQSITVTSSGIYDVIISDGKCVNSDEVQVTFNALPILDLGADILACEGTESQLDAGSGFVSYLWNTGATTQTISASEPGAYSVSVSDGTCLNTDEISVSFVEVPELDLGEAVSVCAGEMLTLDAGSGFDSYYWSTGEISQIITVSESGKYIVSTGHICGSPIDSIEITFHALPILDLGPDIMITEEEEVTLDAGSGFYSYLWNTGEIAQGILISDPEVGTHEYAVLVTDINECSATDTVLVTVEMETGMEKSILSRNVILYPNPAGNRFFVALSDPLNRDIMISIYDGTGKLLVIDKWEEHAQDQVRQINVSELHSGMYFIRFWTDEEVAIRKLIVK